MGRSARGSTLRAAFVAPPPMIRAAALVRAQMSGEVMGERTPVAALAMQFVVAGLLCLVVRGEVGGFGYALFALSIPVALTAVPLLGELAPLLRADPASEWVGALPVTRRDLRLARVGTLLAIVGMLALASLVPAALLAPEGFSAADRARLVGQGLALTWSLAAALLVLQAGLQRFGEAPTVALQTGVFLGVLVGLLAGLRRLPALAELTGAEPALAAVPQAWFAAWLAPAAPASLGLAAAAAAAAAAVALALAPFPPAPRARSTRSPVAVLLRPARALAERLWVRPPERGPFGLVYDALPAERDFVVRTYPLVAAPLLFLALGAEPDTVEGEGLFALLLFAPAAYLPFVLMHVPTTATPAARWLVDTSPLDARTEDEGALKAVAVRLLLPLYLALGGLVAALASPELALRVGPVAVAVGLVTLRLLARRPSGRPLSVRAQDLASAWNEGLGGTLIGVGVAMTLIAVAAWRLVPSAAVGWSALGAVAAAEVVLHGRVRRG